jgi:hypothetical protein
MTTPAPAIKPHTWRDPHHSWRSTRRAMIEAEMNRITRWLALAQHDKRAISWNRAKLSALRQEMDDLEREVST